ncbi:MAG TPA: methyltransferase domain-containing protein [Candidatus Paceibacterota bacterium]|nr:methyltransferase domain-containing protein [Candidatus Paceibacterota bacterium]
MEESSFLNPTYALQNAGLHEGQDVADFGAGSGFFTRAAARIVGDGQVWAVDDNGELLTRIKSLCLAEGIHNVDILRGNIESPKGCGLPAQHFDMVIAANILFSAHNKHQVVTEISRVLKKTGRALVIDWSSSHGGLGPHPDHVISKEDARRLFEEGGFQYQATVPAGAYHWGFTVRKKAGSSTQ